MKEQLKELLKQQMSTLSIDYPNDLVIEKCKDKNNGDYASNLAMKLASVLKKNPLEIANMLTRDIHDEKILKIEVKAPGFINFFVTRDYLLENIDEVLEKKENYGKSNVGEHRKVNLEFVSANPTGILHLGHARGAALGDSLANILTFAGYEVTREYYVNDAGNQINNLGLSLLARYKECCNIEVEFPENGYHGQDIIIMAKELYQEYQTAWLDKDLSYFKEYAMNRLLARIEKDLKRFGVVYDKWTKESSIYQEGRVEQAIEKLKQSNNTYIENDALFLKTTKYGDDKDRVLIKKDKTNTYLLPDIAYHTYKYERGFDELIDILGADHHGYTKRLKASIEMMGYDSKKLEILILQMVRLLRNGEEVKMSKRTGNAVALDELLDEVGKDVARYFFVSHSPDTQIDFDLDLALQQSNDNPVYYINYAHARICSILNANLELLDKKATYKSITSDSAYNVLEKVYEFKEVAKKCAIKKEVHPIVNYVYDLASLFHNYYANEKIITSDTEYTIDHLALIRAVQITIKNALSLVGINAYEKM